MSKKSSFTEKVKKINEFVKENPWIVFFTGLVSLKEIGVWIWKISAWVHKKILSKMVKEIWEKIKEINWTWNKGAIFLALTFSLLIYFFRKQICNRFLAKAKEDLTHFGSSVNDVVERLKRRRGGELNRSILLYQAGSHKYGYNKLDESRQKDVYWLFRTNQEDEWTERQVIREKLVDQVGHNFNLKRDEKKIKKHFRPIDELKRELKWVNEEIREITIKNPHERSETEQKRLEELFVDEERLKTELYYSERFFIVL